MRIDGVLGALLRFEVPEGADVAVHVGAVAESFLRAGGVLSIADWLSMEPETRAIFENAGERVWRERAALIGVAAQSPAAAQVVSQGLTPEQVDEHVALERAASAAAAELRGTS